MLDNETKFLGSQEKEFKFHSVVIVCARNVIKSHARERESGEQKKRVEAQRCCHACIIFTCKFYRILLKQVENFPPILSWQNYLHGTSESEEIMFLRFYNPVVSPSHSRNISKHVRLQHIELTYEEERVMEVVRIVVWIYTTFQILQIFVIVSRDEKLQKNNKSSSLDNSLIILTSRSFVRTIFTDDWFQFTLEAHTHSNLYTKW